MKKIIFSELSSYLNSHSLIVRTNISSNECFSELKSLNIASKWELPILIVKEINRHAQFKL